MGSSLMLIRWNHCGSWLVALISLFRCQIARLIMRKMPLQFPHWLIETAFHSLPLVSNGAVRSIAVVPVFEWEKWLDVVRRLEQTNVEMWCILTDNNVRTRSTKMRFNKSNVHFNSAWVSVHTPHAYRLIGDRYGNERRPLIRAMFYSVSNHLNGQIRLFALWHYEIYAHFLFSTIPHVLFFFFLRSFCVRYWLIRSYRHGPQCVRVRVEP